MSCLVGLLFVLVTRFKPIKPGFSDSSDHKESACNARDLGLIPWLGKSPGEGKNYPLQHSGLQNSMDCIVYRQNSTSILRTKFI